MKCKIGVPLVYFRDAKSPECLSLSDQRLAGCVPLMVEITRYEKKGNMIMVEMDMVRDHSTTYMFSLNDNLENQFFDDMHINKDSFLLGRKMLGYFSAESGMIKALQPKY